MLRSAWIMLARLAISLLAVSICLAMALLVLAWLGFGRQPGESIWIGIRQMAQVMWERSLLPGHSYRYWIQTLVAATPIMLTGLAVAVAFRAGVLNIGGEGQYIAGAIAATVVGLHAGHAPAPVVQSLLLIASIFGGAALASVAAVLGIWRKVPVVLSTLMLNFIAIVVLKSLLQGWLHEAGAQLQSEQLPESARLPHLLIDGRWTQLHLGFVIALCCALLLSVILRYTTLGFRLRAVGENSTAARFAGMPVGRTAVITLAMSGALAGLAGGIQISAVPAYQLLPSTGASGFGFTGIAVGLLGRLSPGGVVLAAIFFGWLQTAFAALEEQLNAPFLALQAVQGMILIAMLILTSDRLTRRRV
jgi:simple sugar transport system permease protein